MSADNWAICPRCKLEEQRRYDLQLREVATAYGRLPAEEYESMREALRNRPELATTLREDYESFITEGGRFYISYTGACQACAFRHVFKVDEQLMVEP